MSKKNHILIISLLLLLILSACSNNNEISERVIQKYNINDNSIVLNGILQSLYKDNKAEPIIYREQKGADEIFDLMGLKQEDLESYSFIYDLDKQEYILILRAELFRDEVALSGIDKLVSSILEQDSNGLDNVVYTYIQEYLIFIKHDKADEIFTEIEKGMLNWDSNKVTPII